MASNPTTIPDLLGIPIPNSIPFQNPQDSGIENPLRSLVKMSGIYPGILDIKSEITGAVGFINIYLDPLQNG